MANLWIRSKDKKYFFKIDYLEYEYFSIITNKNNMPYTLGEYSTKERCIEIIDEIQSLLVRNDKVVYEMPKE